MTLAHAINESLQKYSEKVTSRDPGCELRAGELQICTWTAAERLTGAAGQRIGLLLPNCAHYPAALVGAVWAGKTAVPLNPMLTAQELDFILKDAAIETVVAVEATRTLLSGLDVKSLSLDELVAGRGRRMDPAAVDPNATAIMLYTSGTSGKPKGVPLSHENLLSNARSLISRAGLGTNDVFVGVLPMFHAFGITGTMVIPLLLGAEVTYMRFSPEKTAAVLAERKATVFMAVPGMYGLLARIKGADDGVRNLAFAVSGGEALPANVREAYNRRFGKVLLEGYGLTETAPVIAVNTPQEYKAGTVGKVLPGIQVRLAHEDGTLVPTGQEGEIQVKGPNVMKGYHNRPDENAATFTADGWFRTGDLGRFDEEGFLTISGRIKEIIIRGGEKIMPREVEEMLCQCPGVAEAAVIGEPDGDRGEAVVAFVVPAGPGLTPEVLRDFCRGRLAEFKIPRRFTIASDLPRGPTGKLLKRALKDWPH